MANESRGDTSSRPGCERLAVVFDGRNAYGKIANVHNFTDATLARRGGQWHIFGAALVQDSEFRINLLSASLPLGMPLGPEGWTIDAKRDNPTQAEEILAVAAAGSWDVGRHCPSYAVGWDVGANNGKGAERVRIYYSGSATMFGGPFAIGFAEWNDERWVAQNTPCLSATEGWEYGNVSEPNVVYFSDQWHMWYSAGPDPMKQYAQGYAVSKDGRTNWRRVLFCPAQEQVFDHAVIAAHGRLEAVFARYNPITGEGSGLWRYHAETSSEDRSKWSVPEQILEIDSTTPVWCAGGLWKPSFQYEDDDKQMIVFFDAEAAPAGRRPVYSIGCLECQVGS